MASLFSGLAASVFASVCLPIILLVGAGWGLDRLFRVDLRTLVKLNIQLLIPAFIFVRIVESDLDLWSGARIVGFTLVMLGSLAVTGLFIARLFRLAKPARKAFQLSTMFYNCGNFGIPVMMLAFPGPGPVIQAFVLMTMNLVTFTAGVFLAHGETSSAGSGRRWLTVLRQPSIAAITLAWFLKGTGWDGPLQDTVAVWTPLGFLAAGLVPIALVTLGVQLSHTPTLPLRGPLLAAVMTRLAGGPLLASALVPFFGFSPEIAAILIAGTAAPTAVNTALLVHEYGDGDSGFVAAVVFYSTLLSAVSVTVVLTILKAGG